MGAKQKAPWPDFNGHDIHEGGTVVKLETGQTAADVWRVDYGDGVLSRLCLQIGEKGRAIVK